MPAATPGKPARILIIQLRRIGDVVVTTPVIDALRAAFPEARVEFLVESAAAPVLRGYQGLDETLLFDKKEFLKWLREIRRRRYDWVLDFMNNPRTAQLTLASGAPVRAGFRVPFWGFVYTVRADRPPLPKYGVQSKFDLLRALGLNPPGQALPRIAVTPSDFEGAKAWWEKNALSEAEEIVGIVPTHRRPIRRWPARHFSALMRSLLESSGRRLIVFGGPGEEDYVRDLAGPFPERVHVAPVGSLRQAAALLARCRAVVTSDNGLMHLSVSVGTPTVTVYGPTWPESWNPRVPPHRWLQTPGLSCVGCNLDRCPFSHECLEWLSPERVRREVENLLAELSSKTAGSGKP
jgi:lipopolysaccharide heptosyltransferase II